MKNVIYSKTQSAEIKQIVDEVLQHGFYAIDFVSFAPDIKDTTELMYVANLWAVRANLTVAFNFDRKLRVFEVILKNCKILTLSQMLR